MPSSPIRQLRPFGLWAVALLVAALGLYGLAQIATHPTLAPEGPQRGLPTRPLEVTGQSATVEVAATADQRARGLMFREHLPPDHGMLFVFPEPDTIRSWMKNTKVPLTVAYLSEEGRILRLQPLEPRTERIHTSPGPASFALEMPQGWFSARNVTAGDRVMGLPIDRSASPADRVR